MQNREELRQKGHDGSQKTTCPERRKNIIFRGGGRRINIVFGLKSTPKWRLSCLAWDVWPEKMPGGMSKGHKALMAKQPEPKPV
jgi:hypothetical protein